MIFNLSLIIITLSCLTLLIAIALWYKQTHFALESRQTRELLDKLLSRTEQQTQQWENALRDIVPALKDYQQQQHSQIVALLNQSQLQQQEAMAHLKEKLQQEFSQHRSNFDQHQLNSLKILQESLQNNMYSLRQQLNETLNQNAETISKWLDKLTQATQEKLKEISGQVEQRLTAGFEKTTATFTDVIKRLALIDEAQKRITELSNNVVSLQEVLGDKRSRGAFGEVQLNALLRNMLPESHFALQHTLSNGKRADCILFLPEPTGNVVIDAKFPLENYQRMINRHLTEVERKCAEQQFRVKNICKISQANILFLVLQQMVQ
jgi:DNA recombination protein RmuC